MAIAKGGGLSRPGHPRCLTPARTIPHLTVPATIEARMQSAKKPFMTIRVKGCRVRDVTALRQMSHLGYDFVGIHAINSLDGRLLAPARRLVEIIADEDLTIEPVLLTKVPIVTQVVGGAFPLFWKPD
jgi:hypothetical protein